MARQSCIVTLKNEHYIIHDTYQYIYIIIIIIIFEAFTDRSKHINKIINSVKDLMVISNNINWYFWSNGDGEGNTH